MIQSVNLFVNQLKVPAPGMTVLIGPNNSGKSLALREFYEILRNEEKVNTKLVQSFDFDVASLSNLRDWILTTYDKKSVPSDTDKIEIIGQSGKHGMTRNLFERSMEIGSDGNLNPLVHRILRVLTIYLNGNSRTKLIDEDPKMGGPDEISNPIQYLYWNHTEREYVIDICYRALGKYLVLDAVTRSGHIRLRLSDEKPSEDLGRTYDANDLKYLSSLVMVNECSDGFKYFLGIVLNVFGLNNKIIILDEPEAFLHPALARFIGAELASLARRDKRQIFVATHSHQFLMGCIESTNNVAILRLTYDKDRAGARVLSPDDLSILMKKPILRSYNSLSALFYKHVIITEGDSDRAFYQEINERLLQFRPEWGIADCLFINANGKDNIGTIVKPLRQLGIPAAAIADFDLLNGKGTFGSLLSCCSVTKTIKLSMNTLKSSLQGYFDENISEVCSRGIDALSFEARKDTNKLLDDLQAYGVFVVEKGQLESWLGYLGAPKVKERWLKCIFELMGEDPEIEPYISPSADDVWVFLSKIKHWLTNLDRLGLPE